MQQGIIKYWDDKKGFGFIRAEHLTQDVFFHISSWRGSNRPALKQSVTFDSKKQARGQLKATVVSPIDEPLTMQTPAPKKRAGIFGTIALIVMMVVGGWQYLHTGSHTTAPHATTAVTQEQQIALTIQRIQQGGPFPYPDKDGTVFQNREQRLPPQPMGYYHEYTVPTLGADDRGAKRVITGGNPPEVYYYTEDHYRSFKKLKVNP